MTLEINREGTVMTCGGPWPRAKIATSALLANDFAIDMVGDAKALNELMCETKARMYAKVEIYEQQLLDHYKAKKRRNSRGQISACSLDDCFRVDLSIADFRRVTSDFIAAQALMGEVLDDLMEDVNPDIRLLLEAAFVPDEKTGRVNVERLQQVRKVKLSHPRWADVLDAVANSIEVTSSKSYLRFYWRERNDDEWTQIVLQFSKIAVAGVVV
ncbi:DUF3164 family protein [Acetobacter cerevisiae]|uniref:DUF3164 family protein n=1 Tax=Acetobacter cerevisiae TaxID=178900 RepID=UPI0020A1ED56|nr:DUF3164 family protein [Acetobacter cerevisiae]MCP1270922.1 DUF3164 family protein [Acetobacter cerevisiae]MCP1278847.1 DUF3164 family protein [Acetobacter cerevisiae]